MKLLKPIAGSMLCMLLVAACGAGTRQDLSTQAEAGMFLWPLNTSSEEARQYFIDGTREFDFERRPEAYEHFKRAIAADPEFALAHVMAYLAAQSAQQGTTHLAAAVELAPQASALDQLIIEIYRKAEARDDEGGLASARRLVEMDATNPRSWLMQADMHNRLGQQLEARAAARTAIDLQPDFAYAHLWQAWLMTVFAPFDLETAEAHARQAVTLAPNEVLPYDFLGDALRQQGRLEEAATAYTQGAELDPTAGLMIQQRGQANTFLGRFAEARADFDASIVSQTGNRRATMGVYRAFVHLYEDNPEAALEELEAQYQGVDALGIPAPLEAKAFIALQQRLIALHHGLLPQARRAVAYMEEVGRATIAAGVTEEQRRGIESATAFEAGVLAAYEGRYQVAEQKAAEYVRIRESERTAGKEWAAHDLRGTVALLQGRHEDALAHFAQADPYSIYVQYRRGIALEALGRTAEARAAFEVVTQVYFNNVEVAVTRNEALRKLKS
jgi:tetratricopeptide (TPR) repeat protein